MGAPSLIAAQGSKILAQLNALADYQNNHVVGGIVSDGGTTQASGANTAPNIDLDCTQIVDAVVNGQPTELAAQTDMDSDAGAAIDFNATSGKSVIGAVLLHRGAANDTPAMDTIVMGAVADTADVVAPTDAEITTALGHSNWVRVADVTFTRTGDTTITVAVDHTVRPNLTAFTGDLATSEADYANAGVTRTQPIITDPPLA